jgi:hypothetical protein
MPGCARFGLAAHPGTTQSTSDRQNLNMKLKIDSDGTRQGTFVRTEQGDVVEGIYYIQWELDATRGKSGAILHVRDVPAVLRGDAVVIGDKT